MKTECLLCVRCCAKCIPPTFSLFSLPPPWLWAKLGFGLSGTMVGYVTSLSRQLECGGQRESGGAISVTSHPSPLASFSRLERQVAFVLLRMLLEPLILGLLCSW